MALDKLVDSTQLDNNLTSVANAIRAKSGGTGQLAFPAGFVSEIGNISGGGGITPTGTKEITITENGTTTEDVTNYASAQITVNVSGGSGGSEQAVVHTTLETDETLKTLLQKYPIPLKYDDEICWVRFYSDTAPSSGGSTNWSAFFVQNGSGAFMISNYANSQIAANSMSIFSTVSGSQPTYFSVQNGNITNSSITNTSRTIVSGTVVKVLHIPFNWETFSCESTEL